MSSLTFWRWFKHCSTIGMLSIGGSIVSVPDPSLPFSSPLPPFLSSPSISLLVMCARIPSSDLSLTADFLLPAHPLCPSCWTHPWPAQPVKQSPVYLPLSSPSVPLLHLCSLVVEHSGALPEACLATACFRNGGQDQNLKLAWFSWNTASNLLSLPITFRSQWLPKQMTG